MKFYQITLLLCGFVLVSCTNSEGNLIPNSENSQLNKSAEAPQRQLSEAFKAYWYAGDAEITSYALSQERYGELRDGTAVTIFVTEDFLPKAQVKADRASSSNIPVLKLNKTKNYVTGIYPYTVMSSTFTPAAAKSAALKISHATQEWCGHVYVQLNNRDQFEIIQHSYFEGEADASKTLEKTWLENDVWNLIRLNPEELPTGNLTMLPSFEFFRMHHKDIEAHIVSAKRTITDSLVAYELNYPALKRNLKIYYNKDFPHTIEHWEESYADGLVTTATKMKRIKTAYWGQNSTTFEHLRDSLGL